MPGLPEVSATQYQISLINSLPNNKILDPSKFKAFADDKERCYPKIKICFGKTRKHCGKRRKCWLPVFSPCPTMFLKGFFHRVIKSQDCVVKGFETKQGGGRVFGKGRKNWFPASSMMFSTFTLTNPKFCTKFVISKMFKFGQSPLFSSSTGISFYCLKLLPSQFWTFLSNPLPQM